MRITQGLAKNELPVGGKLIHSDDIDIGGNDFINQLLIRRSRISKIEVAYSYGRGSCRRSQLKILVNVSFKEEAENTTVGKADKHESGSFQEQEDHPHTEQTYHDVHGVVRDLFCEDQLRREDAHRNDKAYDDDVAI